jgi:alkanesulfonate monooxygenase SsuD/methylene tetrahydromethanopterin reductase-like flavin-dependent oxidoreductase (luciferase family)
MTREALDIILKLWASEEPFHYEGKFWKVDRPAEMFGGLLRPHFRPVQQPHPPIGVAGLSKKSDTLSLAGERGFIPMSLNFNPSYVASHWESVEAGARRAGRSANRRDWRIVREVFVADSDEEAWRLSVGGMMGRMYESYYLRLLGNFGFLEFLKHSPDVPDGDVTAEYCARHNWVVGSPRTVTERLEEIYDELGGFGCLLLFCFDYAENPRAWHHSMELLAKEVIPRLAHLEPHSVAA